MTSRVVRLIHGRQSMWATPSCLTTSLIQISRNYLNVSQLWNYWTLHQLEKRYWPRSPFQQRFPSVPVFVVVQMLDSIWRSFNIPTQPWHILTDQNFALLVELDCSSRTNPEIKCVPDVYAHLLQHLEPLYRMSSKYSPIHKAKHTTS